MREQRFGLRQSGDVDVIKEMGRRGEAQSKVERSYGADEVEFNQLLNYNNNMDLDRNFIR